MELEQLPVMTVNLRYLLWRHEHDHTKWADVLKKAIGPDDTRCRALIAGSSPSVPETRLICERFGAEKDTFVAASLIDFGVNDMVKKNVVYLMNGLPQGSQKELAALLKVRKETVSRWATGRLPPAQRHRRSILRFAGLPETLSMERVPLFLSIEPVGAFQQRAWLRQKLEAIRHEELGRLFPALDKLLQTT
jgi:hypothetical protein